MGLDQGRAARVLPVDLEELSDLLEGDITMGAGGYVDLRTGEVVPEALTDPGMVGEDGAVDVEDDPDRWLAVWRTGSGDGWDDMALFADEVKDLRLRERLHTAVSGKGAFRRFKDAVYDAGIADDWHRFSNERRMGRARAYMAGEGIRVRP